MYRSGLMPFLGKEAIRAFLSQKSTMLTCDSLKSDVASSGDLGYTYGKYEMVDASPNPRPIEKGYYVRMWKRTQTRKWEIVLDVTTALPAESGG